MALYKLINSQPVRWLGEVINNTKYPISIEEHFTDTELSDIGLFRAESPEPIQAGREATGELVLIVNGKVKRVTTTQPIDLPRARLAVEISGFQAHVAMVDWGILDEVTRVANVVGHPIDIAVNRANLWKRTSPAITSLFSSIVMPDGSTPTDETVDEFFKYAQGISV